MKLIAFSVAAIAGVFLLTGCETETSGGANVRGKERGIRVILDSRSQSGTTLAQDMFNRDQPQLESLRMRGLPDAILRDLERYIKQDIEDIITKAIVPVYSKAFTDDEITAIANFLVSAPGGEFIAQSRMANNITTILERSKEDLRPQIREFLLSPAGRKFITTSQTVYIDSRNAIQELWVASAPQRELAIQQIIQKNQNRN